MTHAQLASAIGQSRMKISRLENGQARRPNQNEIIKILDALGVAGAQWTELIAVARDAAERGWWVSYGEDMGARQALYADLEAGASAIVEFQQPFIPGLLQTPEFAEQRQAAESHIGPVAYSSDRAVQARRTRQRMLRRPDGPRYEVVLDEVALRRLSAPPEVIHAQVKHLITVAGEDAITVRLLPVDAVIAGYSVPRSAFSLYTYPDPNDPQVVAVDTVTSDLVLTSLTEPQQVARYTALYQRLCDAALSPADSIVFLTDTAGRLAAMGAP